VTPDELDRRLEPILGRESDPEPAPDPVNAPMIRHFCEAVGDRNPVHLDEDFAAKSLHGGLVAPPAMLQTWGMRGLRPREDARSGSLGEALGLLDEAGYTSVVATNCRQEYARYLRPGDRLTLTSQIRAVSPEKQTALGTGRFVDQLMVYRDADGEEVARMEFRTPAARPQKRRPRPAQTSDNAFFWEGVRNGELLIQRCRGCQRLRHPPGPMCPHCHSFEWDAQRATGRGRVYSFVVAHHPPVPPFDYPNLIALIELEEGTRIVSNLVGIDPADAEIGQAVEVAFTQVDPELVLPLFQPVSRS
jgi:uncharacterized OB-fold protein